MLSSKIRQFYFGSQNEISMNNSQSLIDLYGDRFFAQCTKQAAILYSKWAPVYLYHFTHKVENSVATLVGWKNEMSKNISLLISYYTIMIMIQHFNIIILTLESSKNFGILFAHH
jgi:hypothetical protein